MSSGQADRAVIFTLTPEIASNADQVFDRFAWRGIEANEQIARSAKTAAQQAIEAWQSSSVQAVAIEAKSVQQRLSAQTKAVSEQEKIVQRQTREQEKEAERREKAEIARELKVFHAKQKAIEDRQKAEERAVRAAERAAESRERQEIAREQKILRARQKAITDRQRAEEKAAKEIQQAQIKAISTVEQAQSRMTAGQAAIAEGFKQSMSGATALARGFALVGAASEEDMEKAVRALAKVEAGVQAVRGTIDLVQGITKAWRAYTTTVEAAAAAHAALNTVQALSAAGAGASVAAGAGRGALGTAAQIGGAGLAGAVGTKLAVGGTATAAGAAGGGSTLAAGAATGGLYAGAGLAAGVGLAAGGTTIYGTARDIWRYGFMGGAAPGSLSAKIAEKEVGAADWFGGMFGYDLSGNRETERREQQREQQLSAADAARQRIREQSAAEQALEEAKRQQWIREQGQQLSNRGFTGTQYDAELARRTQEKDRSAVEDAKRRVTSAEEATRNKPPSVVEAAKIDEELSAAQQALAEAEERAVQSAQERLRTEQQVTAEKMAGADRLIKSAQDELSLRQQLIDQEKERFMSVKERIAMMSDEEQAQFMDQVNTIRQKRARGETLSAEETRFAQQWRGVKELDETFGESVEARSRGVVGALGFDDQSQEEIDKINRGEFGDKDREFHGKATSAIEATIKDQREMKVTLERDDDKLARDIAEEVRRLEEERDQRLIAKLQEIFPQLWQQDIDRKIRQVAAGRNAKLGNH
jgi:hypothetical protein